MKIYEKPMAIVNKFDVEDVIAASVYNADSPAYQEVLQGTASYQEETVQGVVFQW